MPPKTERRRLPLVVRRPYCCPYVESSRFPTSGPIVTGESDRSSPDGLMSPGGADGRRLGAGLSFGAAAVVLAATFLPVVTGNGDSVGFFDCEGVPGCQWLALPQFVAVAVFLLLGALVLAGRAGRGLGPELTVAGTITIAVTLGWAGFVMSQSEFDVSLGPGPLLGLLGGVLGLSAGLTLTASRSTGAAEEPSPAGYVKGRTDVWKVLPGLVGAVGVGAAAFIPYAQFSEGEDTSIADCGVAGCGWFALEPIALALGVLVLAVLVALGVIGPRIAALVFGLGGVWGGLLYLGFVGYSLAISGSDSFGPEAKIEAGAWIGLAGAVMILISSGLSMIARPRGTSVDRPVDAGRPPSPASPLERDERL